MQTSQVTNPANLFSTPTSNKQADTANTGESFGQVLSREVSERVTAPEPVKTPATPLKNSKTAKSPEPASSGNGKSTGATTSKSTTSTDKTDASEDTADAEEATSQVSDELLALVANLNQLSISAAQATDAANDPATTDGGQILVAAGLIRPDAAVTSNALEQATGARVRSKADADADALTAIGDDSKKRSATVALDADASTAAVADLAAKGRELMNVAAKEGGSDFTAQMKDSLAAAVMQPAQAAALMNVHAQGGLAVQASEKLTPAVGSPGWDQALGQKIVWMVAGEQQSASLTLNPPDLGPLQVVLSVNNAQANATFTSAQPEVRQALEAAMPKLRDMLGEAGIQLGQATVNSGSANQQGAQDQQASHGRRGFDNGSSNGRIDEPVRVGRVAPSSSGEGMVDTFA